MAAVAAAACTSASATTGALRARVTPVPTALATASWSPTIKLTRDGRPAAARLVLKIRKGSARRSFAARAQRRGVYRVRVIFPSNGRWSWSLDAGRRSLARGAISVSAPVTFDLPYDLAVLADGNVLFLDRGRILRLDRRTRRVSVYARTPSRELVSMERLDDGTLFVTDFPANRILRVDRAGRSSVVAQVAAPADPSSTQRARRSGWRRSRRRRRRPCRRCDRTRRAVRERRSPARHRPRRGRKLLRARRACDQSDRRQHGAVSRFADIDGIKLLVAPDGSVYGVVGSPAGGRVVRVAPDGSATTVAGTGSLGPHRDGPALEAGVLPSAVQFAPDGSLIVTQVEPIPAIRLVDRPGGTITTLARGRRR